MKSRVVAAMAGLALAASFAGSAAAQLQLGRPGGGGGGQAPAQQDAGGMVSSVNEQTLMRLLAPAGFQKGEVLKLENGLRAIKGEMNGTPVFALLTGCQNADCAGFSFYVFFGQQQVNAAFINGYNRDKRFGRLYTDKENNLTLSMDVHLIGGTSAAFVGASGALFAGAIKSLVEYRPE